MTILKCLTDTSKYYRAINKAIEMLEKKYSIEVLFAGVIGSVAMGFANKSSDIDLYVIFHTSQKSLGTEGKFNYRYNYSLIDIFLLDDRLLNKNIAFLPYDELIVKYNEYMKPANLYHHDKFDYNWLPGSDNCKLTAFIGELLFAGLIVDNRRFLAEHLSELRHLMNVYSFCKRRYISSYGRLMNYLIEPGNVRLRSYLFTIYEILTLNYLLKENEMPTHNFEELITFCENEHIIKIINEFYQINKQSISKEKLIIDPEPKLNTYISQQLELIKPKLLELYNTRHEKIFDVCLFSEVSR